MRPMMLLSLALLGACDHDVDPSPFGASWDPTAAAAATDGLYVPLPAAGDVARVLPTGAVDVLDLEPWRVDRVEAAPGGETMLMRVQALRCEEDPARRPPELVDDCEGELRTEGELRVMRDGEVAASQSLAPVFGPFTFSDDARWAATVPDPEAATRASTGVISLDTVVLVDLADGAIQRVPVGFDTRAVRFLPNADGEAVGMVVLSDSEVAIIDLQAEVPEVTTVYPLTLPGESGVTPLSVALTASRSHALVTVQGRSDLYTLDLVDPSINLVALSGTPVDAIVDTTHDRSLLVYGGTRLDVVDHDTFELRSITLDGPVSRLFQAGDTVFATAPAGSGSTQAFRVDLTDPERVTVDRYRLGTPAQQVWMAPDGRFALIGGGSQVSPRLQVARLASVDGDVDTDVRVLVTEGQVLDVAWSDPADGATATLLMRDVERAYRLDPAALAVDEIRLSRPPAALGATADGTPWVAHRDPFGRISLLTDDGVVTADGFARHDRYAPQQLLQEEE